MLTNRIYRAARPAADALDELRRGGGSQFCPRCVGALDRLLEREQGSADPATPPVAAAS
jgi:HD-GYP domain-containing protein (c-di-GMP phosphodiesterase class II)